MQYILNQEEYDEYMALKNKGEPIETVCERTLYEDLMKCSRFETYQLASFPPKTLATFSIDPEEASDIMKEIVRSKAGRLGIKL